MAGTVVVATNGTDMSSCGSPVEPCLTLRYALSERIASTDSVLVMPGTYYDANITLELAGNVSIEVCLSG